MLTLSYSDRQHLRNKLYSNEIGFIDFNRIHACIIHDVSTMYDRAVSNFESCIWRNVETS